MTYDGSPWQGSIAPPGAPRAPAVARTSGVPRTVAALAVFLALAAAAPASAPAQELPQAPYLTTPTGTVQRMLELVEVTARDTLYDLGSGDGRIPIIAAGRYGATGVGVELRRDLVEEARRRARSAGVADRVRFIRDDLFDVDLAPATVVTLYLLPSVNLRLRPKLLAELRPGARVVSNGFSMGAWEPDRTVRDLEAHMVLYAWVVPARAAGRWRLTTPDGGEVALDIEQRFQELRVRAGPSGSAAGGPASGEVEVTEPALEGRDIAFTLTLPDDGEGGRSGAARSAGEVGRAGDPDAGASVRYTGTVMDGRMRGTTEAGEAWSAVRLSGGEGALETWRGGRR